MIIRLNKKINYLLCLLVVFIIFFIIKFLFIDIFFLPTQSMYPSLKAGDYLYVDKNEYGVSNHNFFNSFPFSFSIMKSSPKRGDIVIFSGEDGKYYVKRVVALSGERFKMVSGVIHINDKPFHIKEYTNNSYLKINRSSHKTPKKEVPYLTLVKETNIDNKTYNTIKVLREDNYADNIDEIIVPKGKVFVLGDNRDLSEDSRWVEKVGGVDIKRIIGKVKYKLFSSKTLGLDVFTNKNNFLMVR